MSHYTETQTEIKNIPSFIAALLENWPTKLTLEDIEVHETPQNLYGYQGDKREQKANIIIRRKKVGNASNDIGFLVENGKMTAFISEYDSHKYTQSWQKKVKQTYSKNEIVRVAKRKGQKIEVFEENGKLRVRVERK